MRSSIILLCILIPGLMQAQDKMYSIVFLNKNANAPKITKEESATLMQGHLDNINRLAKEGKLLAAGPFEGGGGLFILSTTSVEEAKAWLATDPGIVANRWRIEIYPYQPRYGSVCPVKEPYEMTHYTFIRYDAIVSKVTAGNFPEIMMKHDQYMKQLKNTGNVITEAVFNERDGGILVMKGELQPEVIENDPGIQAGLIQHEIKKLYIAEGSFCE
ncbi:MAG TPA: YciI family protein [Ohtaekwangia sp.]|nr:YciI family protein [Ohtaekwangia sp.]